MRTQSNVRKLLLTGSIAAVIAVPGVHSANVTWDTNTGTSGVQEAGGTFTWAPGDLKFWDGVANVATTNDSTTDIAQFGNGATLASVATVNVSTQSINGLIFGATTTNGYTLTAATAGQVLTIGGSGITVNSGAQTTTVGSANLGLTLGTAQTWTNNSASNLVINGAVAQGANTLTFDGSGAITFGTATTGVITGSGAIIKNGTGALVLSAGSAPSHAITGNITLNSGSIHFQNTVFGGKNTLITGGYLGGRFGSNVTWSSGLGTGTDQIQITGGISGFSGEGGTVSTFQIGGALSTLKWGASGENGALGFFNPSVFIAGGSFGQNVNGKGALNNGIDLNGSNRTITSLHTNGDGASTTGFTINGAISNSAGTTAGFEKTGPGNVILAVANSYNGTTTITGGSLTVGGSDRLGNASATNTLIFNGGSLLASGAITSPATRSVTLGSTGIINSNGFAVGIAGDIGGAGGLIKNGTGTLTLSGTNSYGGVTSVNAGTLAIAKEVSLYNDSPASWTAAAVNVRNGATLALNVDSPGTAGFSVANLNTIVTNISVANNAAEGLQAGANLGLDTSTAFGATFTPSAALADSTGASGGRIGLTKLGAGTLVLEQTNTYTGATTVTGGTLQLGSGTAAGSLSTSSVVTVGTGATFAVNQTDTVTQGTDFSGVQISGAGGFTQAGSGTTVLNQANTFSGTTTISAGKIVITNPAAPQNSAYDTTGSNGTTVGLDVTNGVSSGMLTLGGLAGSVDLSSAFTAGFTGPVTNLTLNPQSGVTRTYAGVIANSTMSLTKTGAGTQILTGANAYTGATIVKAGTLTVGVGGSLDATSALQISGGTFSYGNTSAVQTVNGLTVNNGNSTLSNTAAGQTLTLGGITRTAGLHGTVNFATLTGPISTTTGNTNGIIGPWATTGATTTLRYAAGSPDGSTPTNITAVTGTAATANTLGNVTDATANYEYSAAVAAMGAGASLTGNTLRYSGGATTTAINATSTITLNGLMQAGTGLLTISGGPSTGGLLIGSTGELVIAANAAGTTISTAIGGTGRLVYNGGGLLLLSGTTSSYTAGTVINAGEIRIASDAALGNSSGSITLNGGVLRGNSTNPQAGNGGGANITSARDVIVGSAGGAIGSHGNNFFTTTGKLTGAGTLTFADVGGAGGRSLNFNATNNDFTGRLEIGSNGMTLQVNSLLDPSGAGAIALNQSTTLSNSTFAYGTGAITPLNLSNRVFEVNASGALIATIINLNTTHAININTNLQASGAGAKTLQFDAANGPTNIFSGSITNGAGGGTIAVNKTGAGTWALGGTNTYSGDTNLLAVGTTGRLVFQGSQSLSPNTKLIFAQNSSNVQSVRFLDDAAGTINFNRPIEFGGNNTIQVLGIFVGNNNTANLGSSAGTTTGSTIQVGNITHTSLASDTGTWNINVTGANGYRLQTGTITLNNLVNRTANNTTVTVLNPTSASMTVAAVAMAAGNTGTANDGIPVLRLDGTSSGNIISGAISNAPDGPGFGSGQALSLQKQNTSIWTLNGTSTYSGTTTISAGTLIGTNAVQSFGTNLSGISIAGAGTLSLRNDSSVSFTNGTSAYNIANSASGATINVDRVTGTGTNTITVGNLTTTSTAGTWTLNFTGANGVRLSTGTLNTPVSTVVATHTINNNIADGGTLTLDSVFDQATTVASPDLVFAGTGDTIVTGAITQTLSTMDLIKNGGGMLTLNGVNTYGGATNVNGGTLLVGGSISGSTVTVGNTAILKGTGSITATVDVQGGGTLASGASIQSLAIGSLTMNSGSTFAYEFNNDAAPGVAGDLTAINGGLNLALDNTTAITFTELGSGSWLAGEKLTIASYNGAWNSGLFDFGGSTVTDDSQIIIGGTEWTFDYNDTVAGSNFTADLTGPTYVTITAVPEPGAAASLLAGLGVLAFVRRRRA